MPSVLYWCTNYCGCDVIIFLGHVVQSASTIVYQAMAYTITTSLRLRNRIPNRSSNVHRQNHIWNSSTSNKGQFEATKIAHHTFNTPLVSFKIFSRIYTKSTETVFMSTTRNELTGLIRMLFKTETQNRIFVLLKLCFGKNMHCITVCYTVVSFNSIIRLIAFRRPLQMHA